MTKINDAYQYSPNEVILHSVNRIEIQTLACEHRNANDLFMSDENLFINYWNYKEKYHFVSIILILIIEACFLHILHRCT